MGPVQNRQNTRKACFIFCCLGARGVEVVLADNGGQITPAFKALVKRNKTTCRTSSPIMNAFIGWHEIKETFS